MKHVIGLAIVVFAGIIAWRIGENLSSDAVSMAVGVLFGVLAGIPTALLVLVGGRRQDPMSDPHNQPQNHSQNGHRLLEHQPTQVIRQVIRQNSPSMVGQCWRPSLMEWLRAYMATSLAMVQGRDTLRLWANRRSG